MKKYSSINIILIFLLSTALLAIIIPSGILDGETYTQIDKPSGLISQVFNSPINGFIGINDGETISTSNSGTLSGVVLICLLVTSIFMFTYITFKSKIIDSFLYTHFNSITKYRHIFIVLIITFFSFGAFTHGMYETTIPIAIPLFVIFNALGYDKIFTTKIILFSTSIGYIGSAINPFATGLAAQLAGSDLSEQFLLRVLIFTTLYIFTIIHLLYISSKHKIEMIELTDPQTSSKILDLILFILPFLIMSYSFLPFELPLKLSFNACIIMFIIFSLIIGYRHFKKTTTILEIMFESVKDVLPVILVLSISRGIYVLLVNMQVDDTIIYYLLNIVDGLNSILVIITVSLFYLFISLFISSSSAVAYLTIPLLTPIFVSIGLSAATLVTVYQTSIGILHIFSITSVVVISLLSSSSISYKEYLKSSYKYIITISVLAYLIIFIFI